MKLYPDWTREYEVKARIQCEQIDRQTDGQTDRQGDSYIPPQTLFAGGIVTYDNTPLATIKCRVLACLLTNVALE